MVTGAARSGHVELASIGVSVGVDEVYLRVFGGL
jgi:hypothetical protein